MPTLIKTLQATFVRPTAHKESKLIELCEIYREALHEAFDAGASTLSAVGEIVVPYDLPYQAKAAVCTFVRQLRQVDHAKELGDGQPVRFSNQAATFDHSSERTHGFTWWVPQPGWGTNFWIPLRINPAQETYWHDLVNEDADPGPIILRQRGATWELLVTVKYDVDEPKGDGEITYVGLDIGETALVTGCALTRGSPTAPFVCDGGRAKQLRKEMFTTLKRLQERDAAAWRINERFTYFQNTLTNIVEKASRRAVEYATQYHNPVIVMEELSYIRERLDYSRYMNRRLHSWAFARLQGRIEEKAADAGIVIKYVNPAYTSQVCHACRHMGRRDSQAVFRCPNEACHISTFQADINAAANIARRANPWGESVPLDQAGRNDSPQDGRGCDTATTPRVQSRDADDAHGR